MNSTQLHGHLSGFEWAGAYSLTVNSVLNSLSLGFFVGETAFNARRLVGFGTFEVDLRARELRKGGAKVRLTGQPFEVLTILLEHAGEVVTREELQQRLWPDTFVDVEHNLNTAVNKIREALGDSADSPLFVQTLPRRGYRFIAPLEASKEITDSDDGPLVSVQEVASGLRHESYVRAWFRRYSILLAALVLLISSGVERLSRGKTEPNPEIVKFLRLTDFAGLEESPSFSPDVRSVAFVSDTTGSRQIWVRLMAGGPPLQLTRDPGDHLEPRWSEDSSAIIYYTPPAEGDAQGILWQISALGGTAQRLVPCMSGADVSHDGKKLTFFRLNGRKMELAVSDRGGANIRVLTQAIATFSYRQPRWSPDDTSIAYLHSRENWADDIFIVSSAGGLPRRVTKEGTLMNGLAWLPDGSHLIYSSARGSTLLYLPTMHLWLTRASGGDPQQLTFSDAGDESPDVDHFGRTLVSRKHIQFDIWKFPVDADPARNVTRAVRITRQTGQVQTPSLDPDDNQLAYLSDTGGHGNLWVRQLTTGETRQITFEKNVRVVVGVPIWSPDGRFITFVTNSPSEEGRSIEYWIIRPDGSNPHIAILQGAWATWSGDSKWLYYSDWGPVRTTGSVLMKVPMSGGTPVVVRTDNARAPAVAPDGLALYYVVPLQNLNGSLDYELRVARPENGPSTLLARISGDRIPSWQGLHPVISRDGKWLVMPLEDRQGTNIWVASTATGELRQITDFGEKRTLIARRISWSSDGKWVFAAVGEGDADIVEMDGLFK
jgi:Tol biopolymer transport system component/DNA-binding winged helix-turn-helix (wHTH) protein